MNDYLPALGFALQEEGTLGRKGSLCSEENRVFLFREPGRCETFLFFCLKGGSKHHACYLAQNGGGMRLLS